jgi:hypothetical protein
MRHLAIEVGSRRFVARLEEEAAPRTCAAFLKMLPFSNQVIHSRWSGEAVWVPLADFDTGLDFENHTSHPSRGDVLLYPVRRRRRCRPARTVHSALPARAAGRPHPCDRGRQGFGRHGAGSGTPLARPARRAWW